MIGYPLDRLPSASSPVGSSLCLWFGASKSPRTSPRTSRISPTSYLVIHKGWREEPMDTLEVGGSLPLKGAAPTAEEDVEQFFKIPKVETQLVEPKSKYKPISLDDFKTLHPSIKEWLPEDVFWVMESHWGCNDPYQLLRIRGQNLWNTDYFERLLGDCGELKNYEEQRLYLKFYGQLSKEVKEGESWKDVCKRLAVRVEGDMPAFKKKMAIVDYFANQIEEVRVKERYELYCHILDEGIMNKEFDTVVAKIIEDNLYPDLHDEIRKGKKKSFVMHLKESCQYGEMHIDEAREHIKTAFFETWKIKYDSMARYFMLKMLIADKLRILPEVLQGLPEELIVTPENVSHI